MVRALISIASSSPPIVPISVEGKCENLLSSLEVNFLKYYQSLGPENHPPLLDDGDTRTRGMSCPVSVGMASLVPPSLCTRHLDLTSLASFPNEPVSREAEVFSLWP